MTFLPIPLLISLVLGLISVAILAAGVALVANAIRRSRRRRPVVRETVVDQRRERPEVVQPVASARVETDFSKNPGFWKLLLPGLVLLLVAVFGRHIVQLGFAHGQD